MFGVAADTEVSNAPSPRVTLTATATGCQSVTDAASSSAGPTEINVYVEMVKCSESVVVCGLQQPERLGLSNGPLMNMVSVWVSSIIIIVIVNVSITINVILSMSISISMRVSCECERDCECKY